MSGIMGENLTPESTASASTEASAPTADVNNPVPTAHKPETNSEPSVPAESKTISSSSRRKVGRPKKGETPEKSDEIRATFIVRPDSVRKLKYISLVEGNLLKDVIAAALDQFIVGWEADNGRIKLPKLDR